MINLIAQAKGIVAYIPTLISVSLVGISEAITVEGFIESLIALLGALGVAYGVYWKVNMDKDMNAAKIEYQNAQTRELQLNNLEKEKRINGDDGSEVDKE